MEKPFAYSPSLSDVSVPHLRIIQTDTFASNQAKPCLQLVQAPGVWEATETTVFQCHSSCADNMRMVRLSSDKSVDPPSFKINAVVITALIAISAVVFMKSITDGGFRWGDAPTHAMDGVLVHDWITSGPSVWLHPIDFAVKQYSHYPTLGMGRPYPPGYAAVEAIFFLLFGVSITVARLCTACFGVAAVVGVYAVAKRFLNTVPACCAALSLTAMPAVIFWTRQTMLEMPTLAVLIWLVYATQKYIESPNWKRWIAVVALMFAAPLFKQTAVFIIPVIGLVLLVLTIRKQIPRKQFFVAASLILLPMAMFFAFTFWSNNSSTHMLNVVAWNKPLHQWLNWDTIMVYPLLMPRSVGSVILAASLVGMILSLRKWNWMSGLLIAWMITFMVMIICIQHKQPRYLFFSYFPIAIWIGYFVQQCLMWLSNKKSLVATACVLGMSILIVRAFDTRIPHYPDYGPLVTRYEDYIRGKIIFFEGRRDGDFIFAVREQLGKQQAVIIRGSKILYSCAADKGWHYVSYVSDTNEVHEKLKPFGFEALFVEQDNKAQIHEVDLLHDYLQDDTTFKWVEGIEFEFSNHPAKWNDRTLNVYFPQIPGKRTVRYFDIPIPISSQQIRVDLNDLLTDLPDLQ